VYRTQGSILVLYSEHKSLYRVSGFWPIKSLTWWIPSVCRSSAILFPTPGTVNRLLGSFIFLDTIVQLLIFPRFSGMLPNVRRYVQVATASRWRAFLHSWCGAGLWYWSVYSRVGKNRDTSGSPRREPGRAVPLTTKRSSLAWRFSRYGVAIAYTDLLGNVLFYFSLFFQFHHFNRAGSCTLFSA